MKTTRIEVIKPINENKTASQIYFGCNRKIGSPSITDTDLKFAKIGSRSANVQKLFFENLYLKS